MRRAALAALLLLLLASAPAAASPGAEVGLEDERLLLTEPAAAPAAVAEWQRLGVDVVRIHARWWVLAPGRHSRRRPSGFDGADPDDRRYSWGELDRAVRLVRSAGIRVMLTVTGPGPLWASRAPRRRNPLYKPDPLEFGRFARAVATRYRTDVERYLIWNEPNQPGWLQPQWTCARRRACVPTAPHLYRGLLRAADRAIQAADPGSEVLLGELAPIGRRPLSSRTPMAPLPFLRSLGCVDARYRRLRRGACARFRAPVADAVGYHPHPVLLSPEQRNPDRDEAQLADLGRLFAALDRLSGRRRLRVRGGGRFAVHLTEFGYQTSPPDHAIGISLTRQNRYLQQASYLAWRWPRVRGLTFYQWEDEPVHWRGSGSRAYSGWQSGLRFVTGRAKPALSTFETPFVIDVAPGRRLGRAWGQVRPGFGHTVTLLRRSAGQPEFSTVAELPTNGAGYFSRPLFVDRRAEYRFSWIAPGRDGGDPVRRFSGIVDLRLPGTRLRAAAPVGG
jgi:hypothetical protein